MFLNKLKNEAVIAVISGDPEHVIGLPLLYY